MRRLALVVLALAFAFGLNELLLRAVWTNPFARARPDEVLILRWQNAGLDQELDRSALHLEPSRVRFRIDAEGYIEPSRQFDAPEFTLAFQGGSTTECMVVQEDLRWPNRVSAELAGLGFRVNARNAGKAGNTAHDALVNLVQFVAPGRPDVVLLMNAVNDAGLLSDRGYELRAPQPDGWRAGLRWLGETASRHSSLAGFVRRATTSGAPELRPDPAAHARPPAMEPYAARVRAWLRSARAFGIEPVLITEPLSSFRNELTPPWTDAEALAAFNQKLREIGREEGAVVLDLAELVAAEPEFAKPESIYYDGLHVNDAGARIYGRLVAQALARDVLPKLRAARGAQPPQIAR